RPAERLAGNPALRDDRRHELARRDVKGGVEDANTARRDLPIEDVRHLASRSFLDGDLLATGAVEVDRGDGGGDVERNGVAVRQDGERVGTDIVGDVAVRRGPIGPRDEASVTSSLHQLTGT